jgi:hypothetical protein
MYVYIHVLYGVIKIWSYRTIRWYMYETVASSMITTTTELIVLMLPRNLDI